MMESNLQDRTEHAESAGRGLPHVVVVHGEGEGIDRDQFIESGTRSARSSGKLRAVFREESTDRRCKVGKKPRAGVVWRVQGVIDIR